jgi:hypothetical protein
VDLIYLLLLVEVKYKCEQIEEGKKKEARREQMITVRTEEPADVEVIHSLHQSAFPTGAEARLVDRLREDRKLAISLIAEVRGRVVGHVAFSPVSVDPQGSVNHGLGLGPVASPFYRAEAFGEGRSSLLSRYSRTEYRGEGE